MVLETVEDPKPGPWDIILKVKGCGICNTDIKILRGRIPAPYVTLPHILGHEIAGEIVALGSEVKGCAIGQNGAAYHYVTCGCCEMCLKGNENVCLSVKRLGFELPGGMAEFVKIPYRNFCPYSPHLQDGPMSILADAVATPYHSLKTLANVQVGQDILIVGIGGLGIHAVQLSVLMGARVIAADRKREVLELAGQYGAEFLVNTSLHNLRDEVSDITKGRGVDAVIELVGSPQTLAMSLPCLKKKGRLIMIGYDPSHPFPLNLLDMHYNEWTVQGSKGASRQDILEVIDLIERGKIKPLISREVHWTRANEMLRDLEEAKVAGRVVLKFD